MIKNQVPWPQQKKHLNITQLKQLPKLPGGKTWISMHFEVENHQIQAKRSKQQFSGIMMGYARKWYV